MRARHAAIVLLGSTMLATVQPVEAALTRSQLAQYGQLGKRFGLTPEQVLEVFDFIDKNSAQITAAAAQNRINQNAFRAIAKEFGLRNFGTDPTQLLAAIRAQAGEAARFERENKNLRQQIAASSNVAFSTPATVILTRADAAYARGDLNTAQRELNALLDLRNTEMTTAAGTYQAAVNSAIGLASARGDLVMLAGLVQKTDPELARIEGEAHRLRWKNQMTLATGYSERGMLGGDNAALRAAISTFSDKALPLANRAQYADDWAYTQVELGRAQRALGEREIGTARLDDALVSYNNALEVYTRAANPTGWAWASAEIAAINVALGARESDTARLEAAVVVHRKVLEVYTLADRPYAWAANQQGAGAALMILAGRANSAQRTTEAIDAFASALRVYTQERFPLEWAANQVSVATAYAFRGRLTKNADDYEKAIDAYNFALKENTRKRVPLQWAMAENGLGFAYSDLGDLTANQASLQAAITCFGLALEERTADRVPLGRASTQLDLAVAQGRLFRLNTSRQTLFDAWENVNLAYPVFVRAKDQPLLESSNNFARFARAMAKQYGWTLPDRTRTGGYAANTP